MGKMTDWLALDVGALRARINELHRDRMLLRFQKASGQMKNTSLFRKARRDIARARTAIAQKQGGQG